MSKVSRDLFLMSVYDKNAGFLGWAARGAAKVGKSAWTGLKNWANKGIAKEGEAWVKNQKSQIVKNLTPMQQGGKSVNIMSPAFKGSSPAAQSVFKNVPNFSDPNVVRRHGMMNWAGKTAMKGSLLTGGIASIGQGMFGEKGLITSPGNNTYGTYPQRRSRPNQGNYTPVGQNQGFSNLSNGQRS